MLLPSLKFPQALQDVALLPPGDWLLLLLLLPLLLLLLLLLRGPKDAPRSRGAQAKPLLPGQGFLQGDTMSFNGV